MTHTSPITTEHEVAKGVTLLTLDDGKANAFGYALIDALEAAIDEAGEAGKALLLSGRPGRFSAGFDLKVMMSGPEAVRDLVTKGAEVMLKLFLYPRPVVIACTGHALAAGILAVLMGDRRIGVAGDFKLGLNEVAIGMPLPMFAVEFCRMHLLPTHLTEATLGARVYSPEQALAVGYLDEVVDADALAQRAVSVAEELAAFNPQAYRDTKRRLRKDFAESVRSRLAADMASLTGPAQD